MFGVKFNPDDVEDKALSLIGENGEYEIYKDSGNKILLSYTKGIIEIDYTPGDDVEIWFSDYGITELLEFNTTFEYIPFTLTAYYIEK